MVAVEPEPSLVTGFDDAAGVQLPKIGQQPLSWGPDRDAAVATAHEQFRWFAGGWKVNAELPGTSGFAAATQFVRPDDVAEAIPCGPDVAAHVEALRPFVDAGFTHIVLVQIGGMLDKLGPTVEMAVIHGVHRAVGTVDEDGVIQE